MSVLDFPSVNPDVGTSLSLKTNSTTFTSELNNAVQTGKLVGDQWSANMPFTNRSEKEGRRIKAFLARLGGMTGRFRMTPPDLNQLGTMSGSGVVDGAGQTGSTLNTKGWGAEQPELFEAGDYIEFNGELKMVTDTVDTAGGEYIEYSGTNLMPSPFDPSGWTGATDADLSYQSITEQNPSGESFVGEFEYIGTGTAPINHSLNQAIIVDDEVYMCVIAKTSNERAGIRFAFQDGLTQLQNVYVNAFNGAFSLPSSTGEVKVDALSNGYMLIQVKYISTVNTSNSDNYMQFYEVTETGSSAGNPIVGNKIKCQAAFFGLSGKFQGSVSYPTGNLMPNPFDPSGWSGDPDNTITNIEAQNPSGESYTGLVTVLNEAPNVLNSASGIALPTGNKVYCSCIIGNIDGSLLQVRFTKNGSLFSSARFSPVDGSRVSGDTSFKSTQLSGNYYLIECVVTADESADYSANLWIFGAGGESSPPVNSKLYVQAAFFGKANDWPAIISPADPDQWPSNYLAKASIPIAPPIRKATNDLDAIETQNPQAIFMLADDNQAAWDIQANYIHGASINCIEDVT